MNAFSTPPATVSPSTLADLATSPQRVRTDEGTVEERPLNQVIQADVYTRLDQPALQKAPWGIGIASVRPPDALGTQNRSPWGPRHL